MTNKTKIEKRNYEIMKRILPTLKGRYPVKYADRTEINLKLDGDDIIEIYMLDLPEPVFMLHVWTQQGRVNGLKTTEDRLITVTDELIELYKIGYTRLDHSSGKDTWTAWISE